MRAAKLLALAPLLCGGCASVSIHDLALSSVQVVDAHDQAELGQPGDMRRIVARMAGDPSLLKDPELAKIRRPGITETERPHELLIKAEFTSRVDLSKIDYSDNLGTEIFFCDRPDAHTLIGTPYVYSNGHEVPSGGDVQPSQTLDSTAEDPLFKYYVFFRVFRDERGAISKPPLESFDLRSHPKDVCLKLVGGAYRAFGYSSNTMVVPSTMIATTLRALPASAAR